MRLAGRVAHTRERKVAYRDLVGKHEGGDHLEDLRADRTIILKSIFKE